jgi:CotH kinase protein/Lamin Tail Domain
VKIRAGKVAVAWLCSVMLVAVGIAMGTPVQAASTQVLSGLVINEVRCDGVQPDFIEIYNSGAIPIALSKWVVSDNLADLSNAYHVKALGKSTLNPKKYARVTAGYKRNNFMFNISCGKDTIKLAKIVGKSAQVADSVRLPPIADRYSWGRLGSTPNGWGANKPTPGQKNIAARAGSNFDPSAWIFDPIISKRIDLTLPAETLTDFQNGNPDSKYKPGSFTMTNLSKPSASPVPISVGVRLKKGYGSYRPFGSLSSPSKSSFKIRFDTTIKGQRFFGLNKLTLNNMVQDPSLVHEWASYSIFRAMGVPCPRVGYSAVYVNGVYWGFYLTLEPYDSVSLSWHYPSTQHLYEGLWTDRPPDVNLGREVLAYNADEGSDTDRTDLLNLISALKSYEISSPQVRQILNVDEVAKEMAIEQFLDHWDGYASTRPWTPNNYYLHSDKSGFFELLPWGTDQTFGGSAPDFALAIGTLFNSCKRDDYCNSRYLVELANVATVSNSLGLAESITSILTAQQDAITADTARGMSFTDTVSASGGVAAHITNATNQVKTYLKNNASGFVRWDAPVKLKAGTRLPVSLFNAYSDIPGTFKYSVKPGNLINAGTLTFKIYFTPSDLASYQPQTSVTRISVVR